MGSEETEGAVSQQSTYDGTIKVNKGDKIRVQMKPIFCKDGH